VIEVDAVDREVEAVRGLGARAMLSFPLTLESSSLAVKSSPMASGFSE